MVGLTGRSAMSRALAGLALMIACTSAGLAVAGRSAIPLLAVGAMSACAVLLVFAELGLTALWVWAPLSVVMFPVSGLIGDKLFSFDHIWVGGMVVLLVLLARSDSQARASRRMFGALALLTLVVGVRTLFTPAPALTSSLYPTRVWVDSLLVPLILFEVVRRTVAAKPEHGERIALSMTIAGLLLGLVGVAERIVGFELASLSGSEVRFDSDIGQVRLSGPYDVPEVYGLSLAICLAGTLYWLIMRRRSLEAWYAGLFVVAMELIALFFTFFRVGWISAVIVTVAVLGLRPKRYSRRLGTVAVAGLVVAVALTQLDKIPAVSSRVNNTSNFSSRLASYKQGIQIFKSEPVFGIGATRYNEVATQLPIVQVNGINSLPRAHSSVINTLAEDGLIGLLALGLVAAAVVGLVRALNRYRGSPQDVMVAATLIGATLAYLLYSLTLTMLPYGPANAFLAVLLGLGAGRLDWHAAGRRATGGTATPRPRHELLPVN